MSASDAMEYEEGILALIEKETLRDEDERGLAVYLDDPLIQKIHSINPTVEEWNGELWCVTEMQTSGDLSSSELVKLIEYSDCFEPVNPMQGAT